MKRLPNALFPGLHSLFWLCFVSLFFLACKDDEKYSKKEHDPAPPIVLHSLSPKEGGAKDKVLLDGENFGTDPGKIEVYFNNTRAAVVSSSGNRIYAIVPRLPGDKPVIKV